jgi:hypoxanthine phosphoribosyltransferase
MEKSGTDFLNSFGFKRFTSNQIGMRETIIHPRLRGSLGPAFEELSEKIVAYNPDVVCPILRAGRYVLEGVEYFIQATCNKKFPSIDIVSVSPALVAVNAKDRPYVNRFELEKNRKEITGKRVAIVDDIKFDGETLRNAASSLSDMKISEARTFCLYNDTKLRKKFTLDEFDKYWHRRVTSIGDMEAFKKEYHKGSMVIPEIVYITIDEVERIIYSGNLISLPELHTEIMGELLKRRVKSRMFQNEIENIIDRRLQENK